MKIAALAVAISLAALCTPALADKAKVSEVNAEKLGQLVTLEGKTSSFRESRQPRAPNSFMLKDDSNQEIRIVIWPDVFDKIQQKDALKNAGTQVQVEGEVKEYREKIEIHVPDAEQVKVLGAGAADASTTGSATTTGTAQTTR